MAVRRVCLYESNRNLLLFLLLTENITGRNIFIAPGHVNEEIFNKLRGLKIKLKGKDVDTRKSKICRSLYKRTRGYVFKSLKTRMKRNGVDIYGLRHILLSNYMFTDIPLHEFEDGLATIAVEEREYKKIGGIKWYWDNIMNKVFPKTRNFWVNKYNYQYNLKESFYTPFVYDFLKPTDKRYKMLDFIKCWEAKSEQEKEYICSVFNVSMEDLRQIPQNMNWLFTQPFSEDGLMSEEDKIDIYKRMLRNYNGTVIIKAHPREITNYREVFPEHIIFNASCPVELLACMGLKPIKCITGFSTAVFAFYGQTEIDFYGKEIHKNLIADEQSLDFIFKRNAYI